MGDNYPESTDGICPVCNSSMERGFIVSSGGIFWNDHVPSMICSGDSMGPHAKNIGGCSYIEALRCQKCSIIRYQFDIPINFERLERIRCPNCGEWDEYKKKEQDHELRSCPTCLYKF